MSFGTISPVYEHREPFLVTFRPTARTSILAGLILIALLVGTRYQAISQIGTSLIGGVSGDGGLYYWLVQSVPADLITGPWFSTRAFYPYGGSLAWSDNFILPSILFWFLNQLGLSSVVCYNLLLLGAIFFNGFATFYLAYLLTGRTGPALVAGVAFQNLGFLTFNTGHPQLLFAFFIPLSLAALFRLIAAPSLGRAIILGATFSLCFLTTVYYALFSIVACITIIGGILLLRPGALRLRELTIMAGGAAIGLLPLAPFLSPYLAVREAFGARRLYESYYFSAHGGSFLSAPPANLLYGLTARYSHAEAHLFAGFTLLLISGLACLRILSPRPLRNLAALVGLGFLLALFCSAMLQPRVLCLISAQIASAIALAALGLFLFRLGQLERMLRVTFITNRALIALFLLIFFTFSLIALGPLGNPEKGDRAFGLFRLLYEVIPGFNSLRAVSRAGIVSLFSLCLLSAFGIAQLQKKYGQTLPAFVALIAALIVFENWQTEYPLEAPVPTSNLVTDLRQIGLPSDAMIVLPLHREPLEPSGQPRARDFAATSIITMLRYQGADKLLVNGYSGQRSKLLRELPQQLRRFPDLRSIASLGLIAGLRYIVFDSSGLSTDERTAFLDRLHAHERDLRFIASSDTGEMLFELITQIALQDDYYIWVPRRESGSLHFEIMIPYEQGEPILPVALITDEGTPLTTINATAHGEWQTYGLALLGSADSVRPLRFRMSVPQDRPLYVRNIRFNPHS